jgi:hypothetical protein
MLLGKRFVVLTLTASLALNALLLAMVVSSTTLMNRLSEQMEQTSSVVSELTNNHRSTLSEAAQLREELRGCRIDLIKRVLGISHPKPQAAPPAPKTQAS